jgi:hypothetical protein
LASQFDDTWHTRYLEIMNAKSVTEDAAFQKGFRLF